MRLMFVSLMKVSKGAKIRNRYNPVPHQTQDTNGKMTNSQLDTTNESQEVSSFLPAGDHKAHINRHTQRHSKQNTETYCNVVLARICLCRPIFVYFSRYISF